MTPERTADQLWRAAKRDVLRSIEHFSGLFDDDDAMEQERFRRLLHNWQRLAQGHPMIAASLAHGFREIAMSFWTDEVDQAWTSAQNEVLALATIGRNANPDLPARNLNELVARAEDAIHREIDEDLRQLGC